jgi:hypothetical protein
VRPWAISVACLAAAALAMRFLPDPVNAVVAGMAFAVIMAISIFSDPLDDL